MVCFKLRDGLIPLHPAPSIEASQPIGHVLPVHRTEPVDVEGELVEFGRRGGGVGLPEVHELERLLDVAAEDRGV